VHAGNLMGKVNKRNIYINMFDI